MIPSQNRYRPDLICFNVYYTLFSAHSGVLIVHDRYNHQDLGGGGGEAPRAGFAVLCTFFFGSRRFACRAFVFFGVDRLTDMSKP